MMKPIDEKLPLKKTIGQRIRERRLELGMEQSDLQDFADVGSTTISRLERGKANVTIDTLEKILEVLGLEMIVSVRDI